MQKIRDEKQGKELLGCTFTPKIKEMLFSPQEKILTIKGMSKFFERQAAAKKNKIENLNETRNYDSSNYYTHRDISTIEFTYAVENLHEELHSMLI